MTPKNLIFETVKNLGGQEAQVLELLYGLGGKRRTPQHEIAGLIGCHPAAVEAIATRAVRKLRHPRLFKCLVKALEEAEDEIWSFLGGPDHLLFKDQVTEKLEEHLPGEYQVAINVRYNSISEWLAQHTCEAPQGLVPRLIFVRRSSTGR